MVKVHAPGKYPYPQIKLIWQAYLCVTTTQSDNNYELIICSNNLMFANEWYSSRTSCAIGGNINVDADDDKRAMVMLIKIT